MRTKRWADSAPQFALRFALSGPRAQQLSGSDQRPSPPFAELLRTARSADPDRSARSDFPTRTIKNVSFQNFLLQKVRSRPN